jgi:2-hydroxycyclohexanecarboxyl-CoA dehydrogenase
MNIPAPMSWHDATALAGKTVVVTGCASGIGRATARQFAGAGAIVFGGDINESDGTETMKGIVGAGGKGEFLKLDLTQGASIDAFVDAVFDRNNGPPDVIASVAGVACQTVSGECS